MPTIAILFHQATTASQYHKYSITQCIPSWEAQGHKVQFFSGIKEKTGADLVISQIDMTVRSKAYQAFMQEEKAVLNFGVTDIRKSTFSQLQLFEEDTYQDEVIVKTELNCGGKPDRYVLYKTPLVKQIPLRLSHAAYRLKQTLKTRSLSPLAYTNKLNKPYRVYSSLADVPKEVFQNKHLIVEKFLPEHTGTEYLLRYCVFLGDRSFAAAFKSQTSQVERDDCVIRLDAVPENLMALRNEIGLDYGKFDYVEIDGEAIALDINPSPCMDTGFTKNLMIDVIAEGVNSYFR